MSPPATAAEPDLRRRLVDLAAALWPEVRAIAGLARLPGGASRENWAFDAVCDDGTTPLVLRLAAPAPAAAVATPAVEAELLRLARQAGVPGPRPRLLLRPQNGIGDGLVMERLSGTAPGHAGFEAAPERLARQCGQALARIHHIPLGTLPPLRSAPAAVEIARCLAPLRRASAAPPVHALAFEWLQRHAPGAPIKPSLVHGDFRAAKLRVDGTGLRAVLDWKQAHLGDPMEDLGRLGLDAGWAADAAVRTALHAGYEDAGGRVDPERIHYWEVFGTLKRALPADAPDAEIALLRQRLGG